MDVRILVINGPNLNMLGIREPDIYGKENYEALTAFVEEVFRRYRVEGEIFQSNHEGAIVDKIQKTYGQTDGIVINPAAYTHTSIAILDALKAVAVPAVEVHLTDVSQREPFRHVSYPGIACETTFAGYGFDGYRLAVEYLVSHYGQGNPQKE